MVRQIIVDNRQLTMRWLTTQRKKQTSQIAVVSSDYGIQIQKQKSIQMLIFQTCLCSNSIKNDEFTIREGGKIV